MFVLDEFIVDRFLTLMGGDPNEQAIIVNAIQTGANSLNNIVAGTNITISMVNGKLTINSTGGGGDPTIGGPLTGGTAGAILFVNPSQTLAQDPSNFSYNPTNQSLTITGNFSAANVSGTNSGDVTLGTANGLGLTGQVISLGLASATTTGALSAADWNTFNNNTSTGNYNVDLYTLSSQDITNKYVMLGGVPTTHNLTRLVVINGPEQQYGVDFMVSGNTLSWSGLFLDGVLSVGDSLIATYD